MTERIVVIGGGLAGISASLDCLDAGAEVTLLEASPRLGGAAGSFRRGGLHVDTGQHVFLRCCRAYRGLLQRLGTTGSTFLQDRLDVVVLTDSGPRRLRRSNLPAPLHLAGALARYGALGRVDRLRAARCAWALRRVDPADPATDRVSFGDWLQRHNQGAGSMAALWDLLGLPALNLEARSASLALAAKVFRTGLLDSSDGGDVGYALAPLDEVHGAPAEHHIQSRGGTVRKRVRAKAISREPDGVRVVTDRGSFEAEAVIVAVAHGALGGISGVGWPDVSGLGASPIVNLHFVFDERVMPYDFAVVLDSPLQWVFDRTRASGLPLGQYVAVSLSGAYEYAEVPSSVLRRRFEPELERVFPPASRAHLLDFFVTREKEATFKAAPGTAALRPGPSTGTLGVHLAGAYTGTGWPATMEGAVRSGTTAARSALIGLGRTRSLPGEAAA